VSSSMSAQEDAKEGAAIASEASGAEIIFLII
jgi:hypothetical protein